MDTAPHPASGRRLRWVLHFVWVIGAAFVALIFFGDPLPNFEARVAALHRAGKPVAPSDLPGSSPIPPEVWTQVSALNQAIARMDSHLTSTKHIPDWVQLPATNDALFHATEDLRREIRHLLRSEQVLESILRPATLLPGDDDHDRQMDLGLKVNHIERWMLATSRHRTQSKDPSEAVDLFTDAIRLRTIPTEVSGSLHFLFDGENYNHTLIQLLESGSLDGPSLSRIRQAYETFERTPLHRDYQVQARVSFIEMIRKIATLDDPPLLPHVGPRKRAIRAVLALRMRLFVGLGFLDEATCLGLDEFDAQLASLDRIGDPNNPPDGRTRRAKVHSASRWVKELYLGPPSLEYNGAIVPKTHLRMGLLAIAAHRYRLDHAGRFPSSPTNLVPKYLESLTVDPSSGGQPIFHALNPGIGIGFDRSSLTGSNALPSTDPGGPGGLLNLTR